MPQISFTPDIPAAAQPDLARAIADYAARALWNLRLDGPVTLARGRMIARALMMHGGVEGYKLGRRILAQLPPAEIDTDSPSAA